MKIKVSNKAGVSVVEVMSVVAIIGLLATIAMCRVEGAHQPWPFDMTQALTRLKWLWTAVSVSSTLAAITFVWLRTPAQSAKHLQNLLGKQAELRPQ